MTTMNNCKQNEQHKRGTKQIQKPKSSRYESLERKYDAKI